MDKKVFGVALYNVVVFKVMLEPRSSGSKRSNSDGSVSVAVVGRNCATGERGGVDAADGFVHVDVDVGFVDNFPTRC